jgi:hypothetical protein
MWNGLVVNLINMQDSEISDRQLQVMAEHPLDTVKIRMQSQDIAMSRYTNPVTILQHIVSHEGVSALFQGLVPRLATYGIVKLSLFSLYETFLSKTSNSALAGSCAGMCNTLISCPPDVIKCRFQMQNRKNVNREAVSSANIIQEIRGLCSSKRGMSGLYIGWRALLVSQILNFAAR